MALTKAVLKKVHQEAVVKVYGTDDNVTISLASDLLPSAGQVLDGSTQTVSIVGISWAGSSGSTITIARNSVTIFSLLGESAAQFEFDGQQMVPDTVQSTKDIVVTITGTAQVWLKLRKVSGYKTTIEPEQFGPYDDPTQAGS